MPKMQEDEVLQQGMPKECLGLSQALVRRGYAIAERTLYAAAVVLQFERLMSGSGSRSDPKHGNDFPNSLMSTSYRRTSLQRSMHLLHKQQRERSIDTKRNHTCIRGVHSLDHSHHCDTFVATYSFCYWVGRNEQRLGLRCYEEGSQFIHINDHLFMACIGLDEHVWVMRNR